MLWPGVDDTLPAGLPGRLVCPLGWHSAASL